MDDIAIVYHWPLSSMLMLSLDELTEWQRRAIDRQKQAYEFQAALHGATL